MSLAGKHIAITGANGGLGRAAVEQALAQGARVAMLDIEVNEQLFANHDAVHRYAVDLCDEAATRACFETLGPVDALLNIAGGFDMGTPVHETTDEQMASMFRINVTTMRNAVAAVVPAMLKQGQGAVVNVGALGAQQGAADMGAYIASKSSVMRLTESMSEELKDRGVRVNAVLPSVIDTPANRQAMPDAEFDRWVAPRDLAAVMLFLCSDAANAVHGALIPVKNRA